MGVLNGDFEPEKDEGAGAIIPLLFNTIEEGESKRMETKWTTGGRGSMEIKLNCIECGREPHEIPEYINNMLKKWGCSPLRYVVIHEGTLGAFPKYAKEGGFYCPECYFKIGYPEPETVMDDEERFKLWEEVKHLEQKE